MDVEGGSSVEGAPETQTQIILNEAVTIKQEPLTYLSSTSSSISISSSSSSSSSQAGKQLRDLQARRDEVQQRLLEMTGLEKADAEATGILTMNINTVTSKVEQVPKKQHHWDFLLKEMVGGSHLALSLSPSFPSPLRL